MSNGAITLISISLFAQRKVQRHKPMSLLNHRHIWSTRFVLDLLRQDRLSEAVSFYYFVVIMVFDWLQFTVIATTPTPRIGPWSIANSWATFLITVFGLTYLYVKNGGASGQQFLRRYFPLSVTVGLKFVIAMLILPRLIPIALVGESREVLGWSTMMAMATMNIIMFWRIGFHLSALSREELRWMRVDSEA